ncbi:ABC transporter, integral membrane type 1 [Penicillium expansum]|uniref:ABC transporter, integral membrane type 1 n=1 Tax=Penicillium expansum TaxID=27334 RepID=A0A0A2JKZ8_PENEN|nr:ABC transporter, integral membrane type 1 [Penicillium expansum]KGO55318.1 ABC transporter, integral membrane type 1 [Penicillium expansum]
MSGISKSSSAKIDDLRVKELEKSKRFRQNATISMTVGVLPETIAPAAAFIVYALISSHSGQGLNPAKAFSSLSLIGLVSKPMLNFMYAFPVFVASLGSWDRIQKYLLMDQSQGHQISTSLGETAKHQQKELRTKSTSDANTIQFNDLQHTDLSNASKPLIQMENASFSFKATGEPVLKNVSLKVNRGSSSLLVGPVGSGKSALLLALLGEIVQTEGETLKQPGLGIAYCSQEPWLPNLSIRSLIQGPSNFDETWYNEVIKACCLDTDILHLPQQDMTAVGSKGVRLSGGQRQRIALARAIYSRKQLLLLDDITSGLDATTENQVIQRVLGQHGICQKYGLAVVLATHKRHFKYKMDTIITIDHDGLSVRTQSSDQIPVDLQSEVPIHQDIAPSTPRPDVLEEQDMEASQALADASRRVGDSSLYILYAKEMGWTAVILVLFASIGFCFFSRFPNIWLEWWSEAEIQEPGKSSTRYIAGYAGFGVSSAICFFLVYWLFMVESVPRTSVRLHRRLLKAVTAAPLAFLVSTDTGVILNRFSQDMSLIDMRLPGAMIQTLDGVLDAIAEVVLIAQSSPWTALTFPPIMFILYILQKFYLRTSRQIRYLDLEAKSPLFSSFLETCDGIATIRGFGWQESFRQLNMHLTDESQKPFYLMYSIQCWLTLVLNLIVMGIVVVLVVLAVELRNTSGGALGVALNNVSAISATLAYVIEAWTSLETSIGALARLKSFESETPSEHLPRECYTPANAWPSEGRIQFVDLALSYRSDLDAVIQGIDLTIPPGAKVGICGRSGSGKSSLILGLLRLNEITKGRILIDDLDISQVPRETIRQKLAALPQDPLILPGSIRTNLDPLQNRTDAAIMSSLSRVGMMDWLLSKEAGLDSLIQKETLSAGQQQLITFARVLLKPKPSPILLLDEATSMVDMQTEAMMMKLISEQFQDSTVIAVAHRLSTIVDFDLVLVMENGAIVESGRPAELLQDPESWFSGLWTKQVQDSASGVSGINSGS